MTVGDMLKRMSVTEYRAWQVFFYVHRWPDEREDLSMASLTALVANMFRPKGYAPFPVADFRLARRFGFDEVEQEQPRNEARALFGR